MTTRVNHLQVGLDKTVRLNTDHPPYFCSFIDKVLGSVLLGMLLNIFRKTEPQVCFAVDRGVLSDMTCTSFTTALRAAERLRALCFRSSDAAKNEDKERILRYVASTIGLEVAEQDITETLSQALHSSIKQLELVTAERSSRLCDEASQQRELVMQETF